MVHENPRLTPYPFLRSSSINLTNPTQHQQESSYTLLASCMHAGSRIVQLSRSGDEWEFAVLAKFEEHKSMNYGSDVQPLIAGAEGEQRAKSVIVSTSFYDKLMCVWSF
jgi:diphthamide biosynthesis protein 7